MITNDLLKYFVLTNLSFSLPVESITIFMEFCNSLTIVLTIDIGSCAFAFDDFSVVE